MASARRKGARTFSSLCEGLALRPIRNEVELKRAMAAVDRLAVRADLNRDERDYLESFSTLIEQYEREQEPVFTAGRDPVETLKYLMQGRGMNASDLGNLLGNRALGSKVLRRERELSKSNVLALARHFGVSPALFLQSSARGATRTRRPPRAA